MALAVVWRCIEIASQCNPHFWVLENPVGKLVRHIGKPRMYFQPWEYGDAYTKKTCLWGDFAIPVKNPVTPVNTKFVRKFPGIPWDDWKRNYHVYRSITPSGFAQAFFDANR